MLFLLRKIRKSLFIPGKLRTYLAYAAGEIILIVVGILIAVQIGNWNQMRKDRAEETEVLLRLKTDFEANQELLTVNQEQYSQGSERMRALLEILDPEPNVHPDDLIFSYMRSLGFTPKYTPKVGVINGLINSGRITLIRNEELNYLLNAWPSAYDGYEYILNDLILSRASDQVSRKLYQNRDLEVGVLDELGSSGVSNFRYNQEELLSNPEFENRIETRRIQTEVLLSIITSLLSHQQSILDLIDAELQERGALPPSTSQ